MPGDGHVADRVTVTFAARYGPDLEGIADGNEPDRPRADTRDDAEACAAGGGRVELEAELRRPLDADQATQSILCDEINP